MLKCVITFSLLSSPTLMFQHYPHWADKETGAYRNWIAWPWLVWWHQAYTCRPVPLRTCSSLPFSATWCIVYWGFRSGLSLEQFRSPCTFCVHSPAGSPACHSAPGGWGGREGRVGKSMCGNWSRCPGCGTCRAQNDSFLPLWS